MNIGILYSTIRKDEKYLLQALTQRGHNVEQYKDRELILSLEHDAQKQFAVDVVIERCISHSRAIHCLTYLNAYGIATINTASTAQLCGSKFLVSEALMRVGVPTPPVALAFTRSQALKAIDTFGYPVVLKPGIGSWGTLLAKVNDLDAAQALLAHKKVLGSFHHAVYYIQKYIHKPGRDIRVFVVGDTVVSAIYRKADFWITHLDHGAQIKPCPLTEEIKTIALAAAEAVGGGVVAVDLAEDTQGQLWVLEVDYTVELAKYEDVFDIHPIVNEIINYAEKASRSE